MPPNKFNNTRTPPPHIPTIQTLISNAQYTPPNTPSPEAPSTTSTSTKTSPTQAPSLQNSTNNCPICLEPDTAPNLNAVVKPCNHTFHLACIKEWIDTAPPHPNNYHCGSCPICRGVVRNVWNRGRQVLSGRRYIGPDAMGRGRGRESAGHLVAARSERGLHELTMGEVWERLFRQMREVLREEGSEEGFDDDIPFLGGSMSGDGGEREVLGGAAAASGRSGESADLGSFWMSGHRIETYQEEEQRRTRVRELHAEHQIAAERGAWRLAGIENQRRESMMERVDESLRPSVHTYLDGRSRESENPEITEPVSRRQNDENGSLRMPLRMVGNLERRMDINIEFQVLEQRMTLSEARSRLQAQTQSHRAMATERVGNIVGSGWSAGSDVGGGVSGDTSGFAANETGSRHPMYTPRSMYGPYYPQDPYGPDYRWWVLQRL